MYRGTLFDAAVNNILDHLQHDMLKTSRNYEPLSNKTVKHFTCLYCPQLSTLEEAYVCLNPDGRASRSGKWHVDHYLQTINEIIPMGMQGTFHVTAQRRYGATSS
jgi:hypothetical protein